MAKKKAKPETKAPAVPAPVDEMSPEGLAEWLKNRGCLIDDEDKLYKAIEFLRSPRLKSPSMRHCCDTKRGQSVPHAAGCKVGKV